MKSIDNSERGIITLSAMRTIAIILAAWCVVCTLSAPALGALMGTKPKVKKKLLTMLDNAQNRKYGSQ